MREASALAMFRHILFFNFQYTIFKELAQSLHEQVGSYALMHGTGFELMDMLLCCKFAEGDSRILQMKLARDRLKRVNNDSSAEKNKTYSLDKYF